MALFLSCLHKQLIQLRLSSLLVGSILVLASTPTSAQSIPNSQPQRSPATDNQPQQPTSLEDDQDELFEKIFGRPRQSDRPQQVIVPLFINEQQQGQISVLVSPGGDPEVRLQAAPFLEKTAPVIQPNLQEKLRAAVDKGYLALEVLLQNGLEAIFDQRQLELRVKIPPAQLQPIRYNLRDQGLPAEAKDALAPSSVSGYLNLRAGQDIAWTGEKRGRLPLNLNLEGALNLRGWVLEGSGSYLERGDPSLVRGDLRLVRDIPTQAVRYVGGDLALPVVGYQNSLSLLGISAARNFALQPFRGTRPIGQFEFFLESPSRVEIFINGLPVQTLQLPAGPQDIRNLPLTSGINDVQLVITDAVGRVQRLDLPTASANELLAPGLEQFAYSFGFPSRDRNGRYQYSWNRPTLSLAYRRGLNNRLTMGSYFQGDPQQQLMGLEGAWATPFGNLGWDTALSRAREGIDYAFRLGYDYLKSGRNNPSQRTFRFALEHRGPRFTTLGKLTPLDEFAWDLSINYSQKLFWGLNGTLGANYQLGRGSTLDTYGMTLRLSRSFGNGLGANLSLSNRRDRTGRDQQRAFLNLTWLLPQQRQSVISSTEIQSDRSLTNQITWNYSSLKTIGGIKSSLGLETGSDNYGLVGRLNYRGYRLTADLSHDLGFASDSARTIDNLTNLSFGTALVFADGYFGWSRPVDNSFALVVPIKNAKGQIIGVNPSISGYQAQADTLGPAVVPELQPYQVSTLQIDAPDLPLGFDVGPSAYTLLPSYKSGTLIQVGTEATVFVRGRLLDAKGEPVALQVGEVTSLSDPNWQPVTLFTNRAGKFALQGLKPGRYEIRLELDQQNRIRFEVPAAQTGVYDLGVLEISAPGKAN